MRSIASAIALSEAYNEKLEILWQLDRGLNCDFSELFEEISNTKITSFKRWSMKHFFLWVKMRLSCQVFSEINSWNFAERRKKRNIYIVTPHQFVKNIDYSKFVPLKSHLEKVEKILNGATDFVGIHIRRTDNEKSIQNSPTELFINKISDRLSEKPETKFFLATDSSEEENMLKNLFPNSIITQNDKDLSRNSVQGIKDAVVDLICLSYSSEIWGSYWSSFSEVAAIWNSNKTLTVLNIEENKKMYKV